MSRAKRSRSEEKPQRARRVEPAAAPALTPPLLERAWPLYALALACLFAALAHWAVFEFDLFWEIRAGAEVLARHAVQHTDEWSHTARGAPWLNFVWLFTVLVDGVSRLAPGYAALPWLRSILVATWIFLFARILRIPLRGTLGEWAVPFLLVPWIYFACAFRLQMRPDLVAAVLYVALISITLSQLTRIQRRALGVVILIAWANFHAGTFPFGALFFSASVFFERGERGEPERLWKRTLWIAAAGLCWFATPIGVLILKPFYQNALSYDYSKSGNPDFQPFTFKLLDYHQGGWALRLWLLYCLAAAASLFADGSRLPALYRDRRFVGLVGGFLTLLTLSKIRAIHYQMIFLLPLVSAGLGAVFQSALRRRRSFRGLGLLGLSFLFWGWILPETLGSTKVLGDRVNELELPVESVAFLRKNRPEGKMLNAYRFGGYLIGELPDYPVSIDGRELPFLAFRDEMDAAKRTVDSYAVFLRLHQINLVLEELPGMSYDPVHGFTDTHVALYPPQEWALVYFDNISVVYLRRTPRNQRTIERFEYHFIRRGFPANFGASFKGLPEATRLGFELEFERCLAENPRNVYCLVGKAAHQRARGNVQVALGLLQQALGVDRGDASALLELSSLYEELGEPRLASLYKNKFEDVTVPK